MLRIEGVASYCRLRFHKKIATHRLYATSLRIEVSCVELKFCIYYYLYWDVRSTMRSRQLGCKLFAFLYAI